MLKYIYQNEIEGNLIDTKFNKKITSVNYYLEKTAKEHLFDLVGYKKAIRSIFKYRKEIPVYFSSSLFLFPVKEKFIYFINYFSIISYGQINDKTLIVFVDGLNLILDVQISNFVRKIKRIEEIKIYKEQHI